MCRNYGIPERALRAEQVSFAFRLYVASGDARAVNSLISISVVLHYVCSM